MERYGRVENQSSSFFSNFNSTIVETRFATFFFFFLETNMARVYPSPPPLFSLIPNFRPTFNSFRAHRPHRTLIPKRFCILRWTNTKNSWIVSNRVMADKSRYTTEIDRSRRKVGDSEISENETFKKLFCFQINWIISKIIIIMEILFFDSRTNSIRVFR